MSVSAEQIPAYAQAKRLTPQTLARWQAWTEADQEALFALVYELQLGENHLKDFLDWCEECVLRDGGTIAALLARSEIHQPLTAKLSRNDKLKAVKEALRKVRYPRLSRLEEDLRGAVKALDLGGRVRILLPPSLEGDEVTVEIKARNVQELNDSLEQVRRRLAEGAIQRVFELMDKA
jgi:hypothetical protein